MNYFPVEGLIDLPRENAPKKQGGREGAQPLLRWHYSQEAKLGVIHWAPPASPAPVSSLRNLKQISLIAARLGLESRQPFSY